MWIEIKGKNVINSVTNILEERASCNKKIVFYINKLVSFIQEGNRLSIVLDNYSETIELDTEELATIEYNKLLTIVQGK